MEATVVKSIQSSWSASRIDNLNLDSSQRMTSSSPKLSSTPVAIRSSSLGSSPESTSGRNSSTMNWAICAEVWSTGLLGVRIGGVGDESGEGTAVELPRRGRRQGLGPHDDVGGDRPA